eukprot:TRINITY_DN54661_c0_g1_i1.p1 TRINITY_DN54661_c0_g1~~TRINITY_DN54661_c0_g1_i1.p1  ORF type:complete len:335 (+),score=54.48 TRINITY_DN54661_c0_g1_i1:218-1222(+)
MTALPEDGEPAPSISCTIGPVASSLPGVGIWEEQGMRPSMEDRTVAAQIRHGGERPPCHFFAVYDGHGGDQAAIFAANRLHVLLTQTAAFQEADIGLALTQAFEKTDELFLNSIQGASSGCCSLAAVLVQRQLYVANAGDCRAVLCRNGQAEALSTDHKPDRSDEKARIIAAGGTVEYWGCWRACKPGDPCMLATSRAIGDSSFKRPLSLLLATPELTAVRVKEDDWFLILACDGVWDVLSDQCACDTVREALGGSLPFGHKDRVEEAAKALVQHALAQGSTDNVSVVVVELADPSRHVPSKVESAVIRLSGAGGIEPGTPWPYRSSCLFHMQH